MGPPGCRLFTFNIMLNFSRAVEPSSRRAVEPSSRRAAEPSSRHQPDATERGKPSRHQPDATERGKPRRVPGVVSIRLADRRGGSSARRLNV